MSNIDVSPAALRIFRLTKSLIPMTAMLDANEGAPVVTRAGGSGSMVRVTRAGGEPHTKESPMHRDANYVLVCVGTYDNEGNRIRARICTAAEFAQENEQNVSE